MVFFMLLVLLAISGATLAAERDQGLLRRLAATAIPRGGVVAGKWGARMLLGCIQIVFSMAAGTFLFHVKWGAQFPMVVVVLIAYAAFCSTTGLLVGTLARTPAQAGAGGSIVANALAAVGGCWWPAEIMPSWMQKVSRLTPPGVAMDALHKLVNYGDSAVSVIPHVLGLAALALIAGFLSARYFRYQ
jgi:ABC-type multidrug transport system permease subunit